MEFMVLPLPKRLQLGITLNLLINTLLTLVFVLTKQIVLLIMFGIQMVI